MNLQPSDHQSKGLNELHGQPNSDLAHLEEHYTDDLEVVSSNPWGQFLTKFILFCVTLDLSDNLTETRIVKNSIENDDELAILNRRY